MPKKKARRNGKTTESVAAKFGTRAVKALTSVARLAMKDGPPFQRVFVFICLAITIVGIVVLVLPLDIPTGRLVVAGLVIVALLVLGILVVIKYRELSAAQGPSEDETDEGTPDLDLVAEGAVQETTEVYIVNLPPSVFGVVREQLKNARVKARDFLRKKNSELSDDEVRANIFILVPKESGERHEQVLKIYEGLHIKMSNARECAIELQPDQGVTGAVLRTGRPRVARRAEEESEEQWEESFNITPELEDIIHPELMWVVSMPLKDSNGETIAVLNIDGLTHRFDADPLYDCVGEVSQELTIVGPLLGQSRCPKGGT